MNIKAELNDDCLVLTPDGRLDGFGSGLLDQVLQDKVTERVKFVIFDLAGVPYVSSAGIRTLIDARKMMNLQSGNIILCNVLPFPENVLRMAGMVKIFQIYPDLEQAITATKNFSPVESLSPSICPLKYQTNEGSNGINSDRNR